jgi:hypothetical protein
MWESNCSNAGRREAAEDIQDFKAAVCSVREPPITGPVDPEEVSAVAQSDFGLIFYC